MLNKNILSDYMAASKLVLPESIAVVPFLFNRVHGAYLHIRFSLCQLRAGTLRIPGMRLWCNYSSLPIHCKPSTGNEILPNREAGETESGGTLTQWAPGAVRDPQRNEESKWRNTHMHTCAHMQALAQHTHNKGRNMLRTETESKVAINNRQH